MCDIRKLDQAEFKMKSPALRLGVAVTVAIFLAGCATTPPVGSKKWHETRIAEIESAYQNTEISKETYLSLISEADQTRVQHKANMRSHLLYRRSIGYYRDRGSFVF